MRSGRPTLSDVAAQAGVSITTVSLILNEKGSFPEATRQRVRRIASELRYSPNIRALKLRDNRAGAIALITALPSSMLSDPERLAYFRELALPTAAGAMEADYSLVLVPPLRSVEAVDRLDVDGAIVVDPGPGSEVVGRFNARSLPVVTIGATTGINAVSVVDRGIWGTDQVVDHLLSQGAHHLLLVNVDVPSSLETPVQNYLRTRASHGQLRLTEVHVDAAADREALEGVASTMLSVPDGPDAVYSPWSFVAAQLMQAAIRRGVRVPEDVLFVTNFDSPGYRGLRPSLTTLDLHLQRLAELAVTQLLRHLDGQDVEPVVTAPAPRLIPAESTMRHR